MKAAEQVLLRPVISEKTYGLMDRGVYVFEVARDATKVDVRTAVERIFGVRVAKVNTLVRKGKQRRNRRTGVVGRTPTVKRAVVSLAGGDRIDLFEQS
ncbi:50S ribosomal protein L23 [Aciditerrimonas ferrireducens]|jgi:large subunit ribosomal protein L23|uniref:Large ribosomal subunit protein uL23 n=1 Tax=Aciditerrimonas ferrireducens TaxID=667306 RepID=A0ABV6C314_9ACTN|nr:50S ribosomal protein L23 [Aciditerrimonas ferrireducens]MCK4176111.1 50S ribosomal protein L23 [Aciditerrimonas ferrireducens]